MRVNVHGHVKSGDWIPIIVIVSLWAFEFSTSFFPPYFYILYVVQSTRSVFTRSYVYICVREYVYLNLKYLFRHHIITRSFYFWKLIKMRTCLVFSSNWFKIILFPQHDKGFSLFFFLFVCKLFLLTFLLYCLGDFMK